MTGFVKAGERIFFSKTINQNATLWCLQKKKMFAYVLLGAIAVVVLFVRPNPPTEELGLEQWDFKIDGRTGIVRKKQYVSDDEGDASDDDASDDDASDDDASDDRYNSDEDRAAQSIQRHWQRHWQRRYFCRVRAAKVLQRWWRTCTTTSPVPETPSEESYDMIDSVENSEADDATDDDETSDDETSDDADDSGSETTPATPAATPNEASDDDEDDDELSANAEEKYPDTSDKDAEWTTRRGKGLRRLWKDIRQGLDDDERAVGKVVYRAAKDAMGRSTLRNAWHALAGRGRSPPDVLDPDFCPERVRARWYAPHIWVTGEEDFAPAEVEWVRSLRKWVEKR